MPRESLKALYSSKIPLQGFPGFESRTHWQGVTTSVLTQQFKSGPLWMLDGILERRGETLISHENWPNWCRCVCESKKRGATSLSCAEQYRERFQGRSLCSILQLEPVKWSQLLIDTPEVMSPWSIAYTSRPSQSPKSLKPA
jgi:hypothetical protein